jgi:hypothetical protein
VIASGQANAIPPVAQVGHRRSEARASGTPHSLDPSDSRDEYVDADDRIIQRHIKKCAPFSYCHLRNRDVPYGGEGGIRTLDGLLTPRKALRNQQLTDSQQITVPCIPLTSPSLAVGLAVEARLLVHSPAGCA